MSIFERAQLKFYTILVCEGAIGPDRQYAFYCRNEEFVGLRSKSPHRVAIQFEDNWSAYFMVECRICGRQYEVVVYEGEGA